MKLIRIFLSLILILLVACFLMVELAAAERQHDCSFCHNLHGTGLVPESAQVEVLCLNCHGPAGTSTLKADIHKNKPGQGNKPPTFSFNFSCADCHNPHEGESFINWRGTTNTKMLGLNNLDPSGDVGFDVPGLGFRNVVFPTSVDGSLDGGFVDRDGVLDSSPFNQFDGVCETCHTDPALGHHPNELCVGGGCGDKTHNKNKACTQCHIHDNFFWK